jgi:hypothetical protein
MPVFTMGECHPLVVDGPARLTDSSEKLRARIDQLSVLDKREMNAEDSAHSECTDSFCKELEKSDLEKAGMKQLKKKKKRKADKWGDNDRPVLDTTPELSPVLMPSTKMSPFASQAAEDTAAAETEETVREKLKRESLDFPLTQRDLPSEVLLL